MKWTFKIIAGIFILIGATFIVFSFFKILPFGHYIQPKYMDWIFDALRGDFGLVFKTGETVIHDIKLPIARTLLLNFSAFFVSIIVSIPLGIFSATRKGNSSKYVVMFLTAIGTAVPAYIIGLFLIYNLSPLMNWFPINGMRSLLFRVRGYDNIWQEIGDIARHMVLPVFSMAIVMVGTFVPYIRNSFLEVLHEDYIRTAKSKGLSKTKVLFKHAFKNAILPLISITAMMLPGLIMSNIFIETVFQWPGLGMMFIESLYGYEIYLTTTIVFFYAALTLLGSFISDIMSAKIDPRVKENIAA